MPRPARPPFLKELMLWVLRFNRDMRDEAIATLHSPYGMRLSELADASGLSTASVSRI